MAMNVSDRDCEAVRAALVREPLCLARFGYRPAQGLASLVLVTLDPAELGLHADTARLHRASHGTGEGQVVTEGELRTVGHHGVHPAVGGTLYQALVPSVVKLHQDLGRGALGRSSEGPHEPLSTLRREGRRAHEDN